MTVKILEKNNLKMITIPENILKHVGLSSGGLVEVTDDGYHIILTPIDEEFTESEWKKLGMLKKEKGKVFQNKKSFIKGLKGLMKK
ncbi:hypothetical protein A3J90_04775 [candidate division WOR-1 bacterium RIFOXYC2_FULL_37_10]|uniref:SpoVT-AbrB domain-containing protein n=1 Tax=candidate division WOR-1 bacterium RIFOXYB2_FULL_37_13 TaxID=1802579 RepID=A0A1F4SVI9_UNCSA|nr:MAG: hypothetical protein A2310_08545 [candidate division WOR-1 bacterium RIFOXYB2_FULL_37_13]OGC35538.1 MAG: hypothetical protein A3J90_04775 [candidate division WOR-1 bacterium RIFOXYC2_FULL_37_10]